MNPQIFVSIDQHLKCFVNIELFSQRSCGQRIILISLAYPVVSALEQYPALLSGLISPLWLLPCAI